MWGGGGGSANPKMGSQFGQCCKKLHKYEEIWKKRADTRPKFYYVSRFCLCWRCTRAGTSGNPDVVLPHWAFWVQVT